MRFYRNAENITRLILPSSSCVIWAEFTLIGVQDGADSIEQKKPNTFLDHIDDKKS